MARMSPIEVRLWRAFDALKRATEWADANDDMLETGTRKIQRAARTMRAVIKEWRKASKEGV